MLSLRHSIGNASPLASLARNSKNVPHFRCYASPPPTESCARHGLIVGCPLQQDREWPWPIGAVDVSIQDGAVPHGNGHVGLHGQQLGCWHVTPPNVVYGFRG